MKKERLVYDEIRLFECSACGIASYPDAHKSFASQIKKNMEVDKMTKIRKEDTAPATEEVKEEVEETKEEAAPEAESKAEETSEETKEEEPAKEEVAEEVAEESEKSINAATLEKEYFAIKAEISRLKELKKTIAADVQESLKGMQVEKKGISDSKKNMEKKVEIPKFEKGKEAEFAENIGKALVETGLFTV